MAARRGNYSNIIVYDERRRYYYLWPQKNKPFLDDEIRDMGVGILDQVRRSTQSAFGDVAVPYKEYASSISTVNAFRVRQSTDDDRNFKVTGGASLDHPAVLYAKGFYIFLTGNLEYKQQMYSSGSADIQTENDKSLTITPIPTLTTPSADRIDIVYVHLHFEEVTAANGTDLEVYKDTGLKNPVVGTETANRLRAVIDIRVREGWTTTIDKNIFTNAEFLGGVSSNDVDPTDNDYKIPIAVIYRDAYQNTITDSNIVDLLSLYNKRVMSLEEITYRTRHGGYTETGIYELGLSGFQPQYPSAKIDEGAFATGLNQGLGTEAYNTNSVTPRVLDNNGKFFMRGLMVGHDTGLVAYETGPEGLSAGEVIVQDLSARSVYVGYGVTGITGMREYKDSLNVTVKGETGRGGVHVVNMDGVTGSKTVFAGAVQGGKLENYLVQDHLGRVGLNTETPGWDKPIGWENTDRYNDGMSGVTGVTGVNILEEVNGSVRVRDHVLVDKDLYVNRDLFGQTWKIPAALSDQSPAMFGFTGIPSLSFTGLPGSIAAVIFKRGVAVMGDTGVVAYGYTGMGVAGQYECYNSDGQRMFTIGDLGNDFDRVVKTMYGTSSRHAYTSDVSLLEMPSIGNTEITVGDTVSYDFLLEGGFHVTETWALAFSGYSGIQEIRQHILENTGLLAVGGPISPGRPEPYERTFTYTFYFTEGSIPPSETRTGTAFGVQILDDLFGAAEHALHPTTYPLDNGKIILKDMPEDPVDVIWSSVPGATPGAYILEGSLSVTRGANTQRVSFDQGAYYGAVEFGGALANVKFAKLDLGEGASGWLFNGDVYFNGNGYLNRVTFSPNVVFRDDIFVYGTIFADQLFFNFANVQTLLVRNSFFVEKQGEIIKGLALGQYSLNEFNASLLPQYPDLLLYVKGTALSQDLVLRDVDPNVTTLGSMYLTSQRETANVHIGGTVNGSGVPFGIHLIDDRAGVAEADRFNAIVVDAGDGHGTSRSASLVVEGDLSANQFLNAKFLGIGDAVTRNDNYRLQVEGAARVNGALWVQSLRFLGSESPEGFVDIVEPGNIEIRGRVEGSDAFGGYAEQASTNHLREKKFTSTESIYLNNVNHLGATNAYTTPQEYYDQNIALNFVDPTPAPNDIYTRWAVDTLSYMNPEMDTITSGTTDTRTVIVDNIGDSYGKYKRYRCERIILSHLGDITITWDGYVPSLTSSNVIQSYKFTSPYFKGRGGNTEMDWFPEGSRTPDDTFVVKIEGNIIDKNAATPEIFSIDTCLGIYIPKSAWWQCSSQRDSLHGYYSYALFYPYENKIGNLDVVDFKNLTNFSPSTDPGWKLAIYPRLVQQVRGTGYSKKYTGIWSLDAIILPTNGNPGTVANLNGKLYISYVAV